MKGVDNARTQLRVTSGHQGRRMVFVWSGRAECIVERHWVACLAATAPNALTYVISRVVGSLQHLGAVMAKVPCGGGGYGRHCRENSVGASAVPRRQSAEHLIPRRWVTWVGLRRCGVGLHA